MLKYPMCCSISAQRNDVDAGRRPIRNGFFAHEHLTVADEALTNEALLVSGRQIVLQF